jgi:phenylacetyl-CoA:acceptor oxidoreductase
MALIPFQVSFAYTEDETTDFADIVLPEHGDLEALQLFRVGGVRYLQHFWQKSGVAIRQPVVKPLGNTMDISDIFTELAVRTGLLGGYNEVLNGGICAGIPLKTPIYDYHLEPDTRYGVEEIVDRLCKAASRLTSGGQEEHDLPWFKEHGAHLAPFPRLDGIVMGPAFFRPWYLHPLMEKGGIRYELPYQERLKRMGEDLTARLHSVNCHWWDEQLDEYKSLPEWRDYPALWDTGSQYNLWMVPGRSMQFAWGGNTGLPELIEAAEMVLGHGGVNINADAARKRKIKDGDEIWVESPVSKFKTRAIVREGLHPDVVVALHMFGHWKMPVAKDTHWPSMNPVTPLKYKLTDEQGGTSDHVRVNIYRA